MSGVRYSPDLKRRVSPPAETASLTPDPPTSTTSTSISPSRANAVRTDPEPFSVCSCHHSRHVYCERVRRSSHDPRAFEDARRRRYAWPSWTPNRKQGVDPGSCDGCRGSSGMEYDAEQRGFHLDAAVVLDEPQFPELVHEEVDAAPRGPDDLGQRFLRQFWHDALGRTVFGSVTRKEQQGPGQPFLDRVEEMVDQVLLDAKVPLEHVRQELFV